MGEGKEVEEAAGEDETTYLGGSQVRNKSEPQQI
jgi:hypothetical protein